MTNYLIISEKLWNATLIDSLSAKFPKHNFFLINNKNDFNFNYIQDINPEKIFIPHWSYYIPQEIYENFECIVFHMTDLPFGRGGSPLQNLIVRKIYQTKISALRVVKELDAGAIYLKKDLSLEGTATEIFHRSNTIINDMIIEIIEHNPMPKKQEGEPVIFTRRTPDMSNISELQNINDIYDYIRMLDADGYPKAFIETDYFKIEFTNTHIINDKTIEANVRIIKK